MATFLPSSSPPLPPATPKALAEAERVAERLARLTFEAFYRARNPGCAVPDFARLPAEDRAAWRAAGIAAHEAR